MVGGVGLVPCPLSIPLRMGKPIYYMEAKAKFFKKNSPQRRSIWIVSTFTTPTDIMMHDQTTMYRLDKELLTPKAKERRIIIEAITSIKQVGTTSHAGNDL